MRVELLYFDGCPNWTVADERLGEALRALGREDVAVEPCLVQSAAQAESLAFVGSPSIRVDGADPFASGKEQIGLSFGCTRRRSGSAARRPSTSSSRH
ncbi:thioredoxin family protein [Actinotalea ferrariae]|uniref:thioredoxin family protein n=1 Tax=Actinotalea ferrariae TaxID=1386098 RepID=UPI0021AB7CC7|nr:thioredoxin family protein [Actinotalea ferrariae]